MNSPHPASQSPLRSVVRRLPLLGLCLLAGCNMLGAVAYKLAGEPDVPAQYEMKQLKTVVLVENFNQLDLSADDSELLARLINAKLAEKKLVPMVGYEKILELRARKPREFPKMSVAQIAQAVGAEQVLYVHLQAGDVSSLGGDSVLQGKALVLVKVVDAKTGDSLWPVEISEGRSVSYETNPTQGTDRYQPRDVRTSLYAGLADKVIKLFYKWKPEDSSDLQ